MTRDDEGAATRKAAWITPTISELAVSATENTINRGRDGGFFPDCTRS